MNRIDAPVEGTRVASPVLAEGRVERRLEDVFVERVRHALDQSAGALRAETTERLALARKTALRAQKLPGVRLAPVAGFAVAGAGIRDASPRLGFGRASVLVSAIVLVGACLAGLYQFEQDRRIDELADVDAAVLNDDLPIAAYADHGFNAYLKQNP